MVTLFIAVIYLTFIGLGLPDSLLGAAWPSMYQEMNAPLAFAGVVSIIISFGTIVSSFLSDRLNIRFGTGRIAFVSTAITAISMFGFSISTRFWMLCAWAVPYGLGAGSIDAALNNYVALHYDSKYMSWLHCMWGIGASVGPYIMGLAISTKGKWNIGYRYTTIIQIIIALVLLASINKWENGSVGAGHKRRPLSIKEVLKIKNVIPVVISFICYCAIEQTTGLWASSYLKINVGLSADRAATMATMFFVGITVGRAVSGFATIKLSDNNMIRVGELIIAIGIALMVFATNKHVAEVSILLIGLGCAPIYPSIIHLTPTRFGPDNSQAIIGAEMAFAYIGILAMPPLFGLIANAISISLLPYYLFAFLVIMILLNEKFNKC